MSILRVGESGSIWVVENGRNPYEVYVPDPRTLRRTYKNNFNPIETKVVTRGRPIREVCDNTRTGLMSCAWWERPRRDVLVMICRVLLERLNVEVVTWSRFLREIAGNRASPKGEGNDRASTHSGSDSSRVEPRAQCNGDCRVHTVELLLSESPLFEYFVVRRKHWLVEYPFYWNFLVGQSSTETIGTVVNWSGKEAARLAIHVQ